MGTQENLQEAFAGESQANRKYLAFAGKAATDGYPQIAKLFRAAATAETVHALAHLRAMQGVKDTAANLEASVEGECYEFQEMYPPFLEQAKSEGNQAAVVTFRNALAVEKIHHELYENALSSLKSGQDLDETSVFVCDICGNTVNGEAPDRCPVCGAPRGKFTEVE